MDDLVSPSAMRLVPYTVAWLPSHFCHYDSSGDLCEVSVKIEKARANHSHFILKLHKLTRTLILSIH